MSITTEPVDVEVAGHVYRVRPQTAGELVAIRKRVYSGTHPGRLKLAALVGAEEPTGSAIERARWEASLPMLDAEVLAEARTLDQRLGVETFNAALLAVDGVPCEGAGLARLTAVAGDDDGEAIRAIARAIQGVPEGKG